MDEELTRSYSRWHEAEAGNREGEADAAFTRVFRSVLQEPGVSTGFTARTMAAVAAAAARDARRARRTRKVLAPLAVTTVAAGIYFGAGMIASVLSATVVRLLDLLIGTVVAAATALQAGVDAWTVITNLGRAAAGFIANPAVTVTILLVQVIAITALVALHRLLGSDRESSI
jgi:hypothetical protein